MPTYCERAVSGHATVAILSDRASVWSTWTTALVERLSEFGWIEGRTVAIEYHWSKGRPERAETATELVSL